MYSAGCDFWKKFKQKNIFTKVTEEFNCKDCSIEWDVALFSRMIDNVKAWFVRGITVTESLQIYPPRYLQPNVNLDSKAVLAGNLAYILDGGALYSVDLTSLLQTSDSQHPAMISPVRLNNGGDQNPQIIDISSSGKESFAIDASGGVYKVPNLIYRKENLDFRRIVSGYNFHLLLSDTGAVYAWGNGSRGELGTQCDTIECETPTRIDFFDDLPSVVVDLACGGWHSMALTSDGDIYSWGWNESGQLGHSKEKLSSVSSDPFPVDLGSAEDPVCQISAGARHSAALLRSGKLYVWGFNKFGQLGLGDNESRMLPTCANQHLPEEMQISRVRCGRWTTVARTGH